MKKINNIVWLFFISLFFVACFEDDNKYDYAEWCLSLITKP